MKPIGDVLRRQVPQQPNHTSERSSAPNTVAITPTGDVRCPICNDAGYLRADVPVGHPSFGRLFPCTCKLREREERRYEKLQRISNLDTFTDSDFEHFDPTIAGTEEAFETAVAYAQEPWHRWLVMSGPCGVGKTHLAVAIARHVMERHQQNVYFAVVPDLMDHLRATFDPNSGAQYDDRFTAIRTAPLLVLDDLGTENATPWAREKLYQVINHRYTEHMPTVITTNVDLRKIDERIVSRMLDTRLTTHIEIDASDFRRPGQTRMMRRARR